MSSFIFTGGDKRMLYAAERLGRAAVCGFEKITSCADIYNENKKYNYAVLPLLKSKDGITIPCPFSDQNIPFSALGNIVKKGGTVFAAFGSPELEKVCTENELSLENYLKREELAIMNAIPTAEGAVAIAINESNITVFGADVLITGFGRIAKILARCLVCMGANVTIACRKAQDRCWADIYGCNTVDITDINTFSKAVRTAQFIFNTVPSGVFNSNVLNGIKNETLYIELASTDGITGEISQNLKVITARGLPGKVAPITAGKIIADTITNILSERSDTDDN